MDTLSVDVSAPVIYLSVRGLWVGSLLELWAVRPAPSGSGKKRRKLLLSWPPAGAEPETESTDGITLPTKESRFQCTTLLFVVSVTDPHQTGRVTVGIMRDQDQERTVVLKLDLARLSDDDPLVVTSEIALRSGT